MQPTGRFHESERKMKKWIRWWGFLAFVVFVGLFVAGIFLFSGPLIAKGIEKAGTLAMGARVDVGSAHPGIFPLGLTVKGLQVTDPDAPMTNLLEISDLRLGLDTQALMLGKVDIREMAVEGIRFGTPRKKSGALPEKPKEEKRKEAAPGKSLQERIPMPALQIPDVDAILARESLAALEEARALEEELRAELGSFQTRLQTLPDLRTLEGYKTRLENLKKGRGLAAIVTTARELRELKAAVDSDIRILRETQEDLGNRVTVLSGRIRALKELAAEDVRRLVAKYNISDEGLGNVTGLLLGPEWEARIRKGLWVYRKAEPWLARQAVHEKTPEPEKRVRWEGVDRVFVEAPLRPDFLVRKASLSLHIPAGDLKGSLRNATNQQALVGSPMILNLAGDGLSGMERMALEMVFNRINPAAPEEGVKAEIRGWQPQAMGTGDFSLGAEKGDLDLEMGIRSGVLSGKGRMNLTGVRFSVADSGNPMARVLTSALEEVDSLLVRADISGNLDRPEIRFSSSLDGVVRGALSRAVREARAVFQARLDEEVGLRTEGKILELENRIKALGDLDVILEERLTAARGLVF